MEYYYWPLYLAAAPVGDRDRDIGDSVEDQQKLQKRNEKRLKRALEVVTPLTEYDLLLPDMLKGEGMATEVCQELKNFVRLVIDQPRLMGYKPQDRMEAIGRAADTQVLQFRISEDEDRTSYRWNNACYKSQEELDTLQAFIIRIRDTFLESGVSFDKFQRKVPYRGHSKQVPADVQAIDSRKKQSGESTVGKTSDPREKEAMPRGMKAKKTSRADETKRSKHKPAPGISGPGFPVDIGSQKELVEQAVAFINEKANEALYKYSIDIGNYLLEKFFDGDTAAASSRNPRKSTSYRALCKHPDLGPSPGALSVMLRVAAQEKLFEKNKLPVEKLSYSHKAELVTVFDDQTKVELFKEAVKKPLTVRQLQDRVREKKGLVSLAELGQGRDSSVTRFNFESLLKTRALSDPEALKSLPERKRNELKERVEGAYAVLAQLLEEYGKLKDLFAEIEKQ